MKYELDLYDKWCGAAVSSGAGKTGSVKDGIQQGRQKKKRYNHSAMLKTNRVFETVTPYVPGSGRKHRRCCRKN